MKYFEKRFNSLFEQNEQDAAAETQDTAAANATLDQGTTVQDLGAAAGSDQIAAAKRESNNAQLAELQSWVSAIDKFIEYLNGVNDTSIQAKLHKSGCDSLFEKIARSETKKIARVAVDLSSLSESLKGYLIAGTNDSAA
jgi:hypothetical protein